MHLAVDAAITGRGDAPLEVMSLLLKEADNLQVDVDQADADGRTPLHDACAGGSTEAVSMLLQAGACLNFRDAEGRTPLDCAVWMGHEDVAGLVERAGGLRGDGRGGRAGRGVQGEGKEGGEGERCLNEEEEEDEEEERGGGRIWITKQNCEMGAKFFRIVDEAVLPPYRR